MYQYKVVPFIGQISTGLFSRDNAATVSKQLQELINQHSNQGWEFYSVEKINIEIKPGCIAGLLGRTSNFVSFDQVIFRKSG